MPRRPRFLRSPVRAAAVGGAALALISAVLRAAVFPYSRHAPAPGAAYWLWVLGGAAALAAAPVYLLLARRLVSPALVVAACYGYAAAWTWSYFRDLAASGAAMSATLTLYSAVLVYWPAVVCLALAAGGAEYGVRRSLGRLGGRRARR